MSINQLHLEGCYYR